MKKKTGIMILVILLAMCAFGGYLYYDYSKNVRVDVIYPGVTIQGISVGGMTKEQAENKVEDYVDKVRRETVTLQVKKKTKTFPISDLDLSWKNTDVVDQAYALGKTGNPFARIIEVHRFKKSGKNLPLVFSVNRTQTRKVVEKNAKDFEQKKKDASIKHKDGQFIIKKHKDGISVDFDANADKLAALIEEKSWDKKSVVFPMEYKSEKADHTEEELTMIKDELGTFTTSFAGSPSGRCANVENGARLINGTILYPGETFSVYDHVAPFTAENGYHLAGSYSNGQTIETYGGGICQVSTTLYNAVLRAELNVTERSNHSMTVHYVKLSADAAISGTDKDFKFTNNLKNPVFIEGKTNGDTITFTIYGKEYRDPNRTLEFESQTTSVKNPSEKTVKDNTLEEGKRVVESYGRTGYTAKLWKIVYINGKQESKTQVNSSSYMSTPTVVRVGTKKKEEPKEDKKKDKEKNKEDGKKSENNEDSGTEKEKKGKEEAD
ncbi:MAG: VanW family protein [Anaerobutyricum sp.]|nr:VanW family protein [Anaerobutyricum sp.]